MLRWVLKCCVRPILTLPCLRWRKRGILSRPMPCSRRARPVRATGMAAIADDSGLCVDSLDGEPGVYSARYGLPGWDDRQRTEHLLHNLENVPEKERTARFVSAVCCVLPDGRSLTLRGECEGSIDFEPHGENGFRRTARFFWSGAKPFLRWMRAKRILSVIAAALCGCCSKSCRILCAANKPGRASIWGERD